MIRTVVRVRTGAKSIDRRRMSKLQVVEHNTWRENKEWLEANKQNIKDRDVRIMCMTW